MPFDTRRIKTFTTAEEDWLWPGYLPLGYLAILDGLSGTGKTMALVSLISRATAGGTWPDGQRVKQRASVLLITHDLPEKTLSTRLKASGTNLRRFKWSEAAMSLPAELDDLKAEIRRSRAKFVIIDPIGSYMQLGHDEKTTALGLARIAKELGVCILIARHTIKSASSAATAGAGRHEMLGASRAVFLVGPNPRDSSGKSIAFACTKLNLGPKPPTLSYRFDSGKTVWGGVLPDVTADDLFPKGDARVLREAMALLEAKLADGGGAETANACAMEAKNAMISMDTLRRAKRHLGVWHKRIGGRAGAYFWCAPDYKLDEADLTRRLAHGVVGPEVEVKKKKRAAKVKHGDADVIQFPTPQHSAPEA